MKDKAKKFGWFLLKYVLTPILVTIAIPFMLSGFMLSGFHIAFMAGWNAVKLI